MYRFSFYIICVAALLGGFFAIDNTTAGNQMASLINQKESDSSGVFHLNIIKSGTNRCTEDTKFYEDGDVKFCNNVPKLERFRLFEIDLSDNRILFYEQGILTQTFPIAYQAAYGKWFQTPTGYFQFGVKKQKFKSSIVPVYMEHAVQLYEDFFIHSIPYYEDGTRVTSQFSGGCIRLEDDIAENFYSTAQKGDDVVSYTTISDYTTRQGIKSPVDQKSFWIRQRFNSPLKVDFSWHEDNRENYIQHTGVDFAPLINIESPKVYAIADGVVEQIVKNGDHDRGLGNTLIISHEINGMRLYALYGHLKQINESISLSKQVKSGDVLGIVGNTGYGCDYWKVGQDGCSTTGDPDTHVHFEIKTKPVLDSPMPDPNCAISKDIHSCVGSTSDDPILFGFLDPVNVLFNEDIQ